jgi:tyrosine decarboxylase/aspartate 1-decarboxylase
LPSHSHHSFDKAADILGLKLIKIPSKNGIMDVTQIEKKITRNTILLVGVAGNTPLGLIDPINELSDLAIKFSIPLHVDASFGGFIIPFLRKSKYKLPEFDFSLPGVYSIVVDPHKMGMAPIPSSCILFRNNKLLDCISNTVDYLSGGKKPRKTLLGTSPGASIISLWAMMNFLGQDGYSKIALRCMKNTQYLSQKLNTISGINIVQKPVLNIIGFKSKRISTQLLAKKIRKKGWAISVFPTHIRLVIMPHVNRQSIDDFVNSLR